MPTFHFHDQHRYTEAQHRVHAAVVDADPIDIGSGRPFRPERITVTYRWRTQLRHDFWREVTVELAGPWQAREGETRELHGSASLISRRLDELPGWVRAFAESNYPNHTRLTTADPPPAGIDEVSFRTRVPARVDDHDVLEVRDFRPGDNTSRLPTALALTRRGDQYSTHVLTYDAAHDFWSIGQGQHSMPTRHEAARNLASRAGCEW